MTYIPNSKFKTGDTCYNLIAIKPWRFCTKREFFDEFAPGYAVPGKQDFED